MNIPPDYELETDRHGPVFLLKTAWSQEFIELMNSTSAVGLYLNTEKGWPGGNVEFLRDIPWLQEFRLIDWPINVIGAS